MRDFIRLTRPLNLLIVAGTMVLMRYGTIGGHLERGLSQLLRDEGSNATRADLVLDPGFGPQLPLHLFVLLVLSTVLIAAGGNVINDYFDTRIDRINKPGEVIVGRTVERRVAMMGHLLVIPAFAIAALWTYSTTFKMPGLSSKPQSEFQIKR